MNEPLPGVPSRPIRKLSSVGFAAVGVGVLLLYAGYSTAAIAVIGCATSALEGIVATVSKATRHALGVIRSYLAGENEAVQYCLEYMADLVNETSSGILGGIQAGVVPANHVVSDATGAVFELGSTPAGSPPGSLALNLATGHLVASWMVNGSPVDVSGAVRCIGSHVAPPTDRFLFVVATSRSGFFVFTTTNI